jgi:formylglycine-generating enzyme required for sulfatase activity
MPGFHRRARAAGLLALALMIVAGGRLAAAEKPPAAGKAYPPWDGREAVADYARRTGLEPDLAIDLGDGVTMALVLIPPGTFEMGSAEGEPGRLLHEGPRRPVTLGKPFYMGRYEVTQEQYRALMRTNPSWFVEARRPVEQVTWHDARAFCKRLSEKNGRAARLPTEAEWEYACRAGSTTPIHPPLDRHRNTPLTDDEKRRATECIRNLGHETFAARDRAMRDLIALGKGVLPALEGIETDNLEVRGRLEAVRSALRPREGLDGIAYYEENGRHRSHPVGEKEPNRFGLYDMLGNVWEWVEDDWHFDYKGAPADGRAWIDEPRAPDRVWRGGGWSTPPNCSRSAFRDHIAPDRRGHSIGFRVVVGE